MLGGYVALGAIGGGLGGVLGGWVATLGYLAAFVVAGGLVSIGAVLVLSLEAISPSDPVGASSASRATESAESDATPPDTTR
nr:hypothetical protein [Natrinema longum]